MRIVMEVLLLGSLLIQGEVASGCVGDCDRSGRVETADLVVGVGIALASQSDDRCAGLDVDGNGSVDVVELVTATRNSLFDCASPSPTRSPSATSSSTPTASPTPYATAPPHAPEVAALFPGPCFPVGAGPVSIVAGDFDRDGNPDVATANSLGNDVSVLLGAGDGSFEPERRLAVGDAPVGLAVADVDGDTLLDLVTANSGTADLSILIGRGDGSFDDERRHPVARGVVAVVAGDLDGDGRDDLAIANGGVQEVSVLFGQPHAAYRAGVRLPVAGALRSIAAADLNADGHVDLVAGSAGLVEVFPGLGDGRFAEPRSARVGNGTALGVGDINGDGLSDLAITSSIVGQGIQVLLMEADGTLRSGAAFDDANPTALAMADFNVDGKLDVAAGRSSSNLIFGGALRVSLGAGDGTFRSASTYEQARNPASLAVADVDRDGIPDLVAADREADAVRVLFAARDGSFPSVRRVGMVFGHGPFAVEDLDGDERADLAIAYPTLGNVTVLIGTDEGSFRQFSEVSLGPSPDRVILADHDGDSVTDAFVANPRRETVFVLRGDAKGFFAPLTTLFVAGLIQIERADLDGDGTGDLVASGSPDFLSVLLARSDGGFERQALNVDGPVLVFTLADMDVDGAIDLVLLFTPSSSVLQGAILFGRGDGTFSGRADFIVESETDLLGDDTLNSDDFDRDGNPDLLITGTALASLVLPGRGDGTFADPRRSPGGIYPFVVRVADLNRDGIPDVVRIEFRSFEVLLGRGDGFLDLVQGTLSGVEIPLGHDVAELVDVNADAFPDLIVSSSLFLGSETGVFEPRQSLVMDPEYPTPVSLAVGDVDADHIPDVVSVSSSGQISALIGRGDGRFAPPFTFMVGEEPSALLVTDLNRDGTPDLVSANSGSDDVSILIGIGDGSFGPERRYSVGELPAAVAVGDLDADGLLDLATANLGSGDVSLIRGGPDGSFSELGSLPVGGSPSAISIADLGGDGIPDVVTGDQSASTLSLWTGKGDGTFVPSGTIDAGGPARSFVAADVNEDESLDLIAANQGAGRVSVIIGRGDGSFLPPHHFPVGAFPGTVVAYDVDGDQHLDLVTSNAVTNDLSVLIGWGDGSFAPEQRFATDADPGALVVADLDRDGRPDLVTRNGRFHTLSILPGLRRTTEQAKR